MRLTRLLALSLALTPLVLSSPAGAQELSATEVEIDRRAVDLEPHLRPERPEDRDIVDTALLFNNSGSRGALVRCIGFDDDGNRVGAVRLRVPGLGLRWVLASDISNGRDFAGSVQCSTQGRVLGSAILLGPVGLTDLPSRQGDHTGSVRVKFPVVVTR